MPVLEHPESIVTKLSNCLLDPEWDSLDIDGNDWRHYVPIVLKASWSDLSVEAKMAVFLVCDNLTNTIDWD